MEIPRHWRLKKQRYGLVGNACPHCDKKIFPPRDVCPNCGDFARSAIEGIVIAQNQDQMQIATNVATIVLESVG